MNDSTVTQARITRAFLWVGLGLPAAVTLAAVTAMVMWRDDLPDPVATHWGAGGAVDGFGSLTTMFVLVPVLTLGLPALLTLTALPSLRRGHRGPHIRILGAAAASLSVLMAVLMVGSLAIQRGLDDAADAPGIGPVLLWSYGLGLLAGVVGWFAQPAQETRRSPRSAGIDPNLQPGETVVWVRTQSMNRWFIALMAVIAVGLGAVGVAIMPDTAWAGWLVFGVGALIGFLALTMAVVSVSASDDGLTVRGIFGWPSAHVPLDDIASAEVAEVSGMADFGGWGWRLRPGAKGIVMRDGEALWIKRRSTRDLAVTVDDAATAAGLLTALVARGATKDSP